jgi:hypothetical protein
LGRRRWRQPPLTRPALTLVLALVLVLHALFALVLWYEMQLKPLHLAVAPVDSEQALVVRLIDHPSSRAPRSRLSHPRRPSWCRRGRWRRHAFAP